MGLAGAGACGFTLLVSGARSPHWCFLIGREAVPLVPPQWRQRVALAHGYGGPGGCPLPQECSCFFSPVQMQH